MVRVGFASGYEDPLEGIFQIMRTSTSDAVATSSECLLDGTGKPLLSRAFCEDRLTRMKRSVVDAAHHDGEPVARGIFDEILVGNCRVLLQPVLQCESLKVSSELVIDLGP